MSSFQIGVISTSIVLGPHINLLQGEITDHSITEHKNETHFLLIQKKLYFIFIFLLMRSAQTSLAM